MIKLNIIPNKIKKEIKLTFIYGVVKKSIYILIIVFSIFGIALLISEYILLSTLAKEINGSSLDFKSATNTSQNKVNEINNELILLEKIQKDFTRWSLLFDFISKKTPDGITFSHISLDKDKLDITFKGLAGNRDQLLSLKSLLEDSSIFTDIDFPFKNLLQKENISFEIKTKFEIYEIQ